MANKEHTLHNFFAYMSKIKTPLVVHNGIFDLMFIYHSFVAPLPSTLSEFVGDLSDAFPVM